MKKLHVTMNGTSPLIMHSPKCVNPLHPISIEMKKLTSKRKKTEEDLKNISDLEWEAGVYWEDSIGLYVPNECISKSLLEGAKMNKNGSAISKYVFVVDPMIPLDIGEPQDYNKMKVDNRFRDVRSVVVSRARVLRTRPRMNVWRCEFDMMFDENKIDIDAIVLAFENSGKYLGLMDSRTLGYGRYAVSIDEVPIA